MAKVIGPLFSEQARGKFGASVVYNRRRGQNVVRSFVIPSNPQTTNQVAQRIRLAVIGKITNRINVGRWKYAAEAMSIKAFYTERLRVGEVWNSAIGREMLGEANANYIARLAQWEALAQGVKDLWETEAEADPGGLVDYTRGMTTVVSGFQLFLAEYTIAQAGYGAAFNPNAPVDLTQA